MNLVSKSCNFVILGQTIGKSNRPRTETILHIVLKFQFDRLCFQRGEASANLGVSNSTVSLRIQHDPSRCPERNNAVVYGP